MIIRICSFTEKGRALAGRMQDIFPEDIVVIKNAEDTDVFIEEAFMIRCSLIFIGACGIAVRKIAPFVKDKLTDPPVIVIDEKGENIIPILSGHMGGANELALRVSEALGANPIITTATDVNETFSVDVFAKSNNLGIVNRDGIKKVSKKVLEEGSIKLSIEGYPPKDDVDVIISERREYDAKAKISLFPKYYYLGIGCKKDTPEEKIERLVGRVLSESGIDFANIAGIASIDIKKKEAGLNEFAQKHGLPFITFSAKELMALEGDFSGSDFVKDITGVDNVCERAAALAAGNGTMPHGNMGILVKKQVLDGVTVAVAISKKIVLSFE